MADHSWSPEQTDTEPPAGGRGGGRAGGPGGGSILAVRWWPPPGQLRRDIVTVLCCSVALFVAFPHRVDWASHTLAGGAVVLVCVALTGPRLGRRSSTAGAALVLLLAAGLDLTVTGPFDPADVAWTLAGALLVTGSRDLVPAGADLDTATAVDVRSDRRRAIAWGLGLLAVALVNRYGIRRGP